MGRVKEKTIEEGIGVGMVVVSVNSKEKDIVEVNFNVPSTLLVTDITLTPDLVTVVVFKKNMSSNPLTSTTFKQ